MTDSNRFWSHVTRGKAGGCWIWSGLLTNTGYGRYGKGGRRAHRIAYEIAFGSVPDGMCVLHKCDVPSCVRPDHLFLGTQADNMRDMARKGRARGGAQAGLDANRLREAHQLHSKGLSFSAIARQIGSTHTTVARAVRGEGRYYADS